MTTTAASADAAVAQSAPSLDVRGDFPILTREFDGHPLIYLDSANTSQKPASVIDAIATHYREHNANVHRAVYPLAHEATEAFEGARERIAAFVDAPLEGTIFTRTATEALNLVAYAWARDNVRSGDAVLVTEMEHHSNLVPWQVLCAEVGAKLRYLEVGPDGTLSLDQLDAELARGDVRLVCFAHVSNVLGTLTPVAEICARARAAGATSLVDGSQAVPHLPVSFRETGADFYVWTGHKALGPTGIGVLHGRPEVLERMRPFLTGGDMISSVGRDSSTWNDLPWKFEAGTSMIAQAVGLGAAIDYLSAVGMANVRAHEETLTALALSRLSEIEGLHVYGPSGTAARGSVISFALDGMHPHDVAELLGREGVCVRAGHHCAQPLMARLGVAATTRASFGPYNVATDVDALIAALGRARAVFS